MTNAETVKLIGLMVVAYPNYDKFRDEKHVQATVALWGQMFADDDFRLVQLALEKHVATSKWPPSIAEIRDILADITLPGLLPLDEAWVEVKKLLSLHEYLDGPASDYMPAAIAQAVDTVGFDQLKEMGRATAASMGYNSKVGLDRVAFAQAYEAIWERTREQATLPGKLRDKLAAARQHYADGSESKLRRLEAQYQERQAFYNQGRNTLLLKLQHEQQYLPESTEVLANEEEPHEAV